MSHGGGAMALVLHAHMPYVEGFDTWPFGEEWLWEATASVYLPLLEVLDAQRTTLGLTPVLCDQLEAMRGDAGERFLAFLRAMRVELHAEDARALGRGEAAELARAAADYEWAAQSFAARDRDLPAALAPHARLTSAATHAILPLVATRAGLRLQIDTGVRSHARRFGGWSGGFWLPECAYRPGLEHDLAEHGVRSFCVEQSRALGLGALEQLEPVATPAGPVAVPVDRATVALAWDAARGYPAHPAYRDSHRRTPHGFMPWSNAGTPYRHDDAMDQAATHAAHFVRHARERLDGYERARGRPGLLCCAFDAELFGHWWYEGGAFLRGVLGEADRQGLELVALPEALDRQEPVERALAASSWGRGGDLRTWDGPDAADLTFATRRAELATVSAAPRARADRDALARAARELLALQASDWAFLTTEGGAGDYPARRVAGHRAALHSVLSALDAAAPSPDPALRHLAPHLDLAPLLAP